MSSEDTDDRIPLRRPSDRPIQQLTPSPALATIGARERAARHVDAFAWD
jgi:hypothetical protein